MITMLIRIKSHEPKNVPCGIPQKFTFYYSHELCRWNCEFDCKVQYDEEIDPLLSDCMFY